MLRKDLRGNTDRGGRVWRCVSVYMYIYVFTYTFIACKIRHCMIKQSLEF